MGKFPWDSMIGVQWSSQATSALTISPTIPRGAMGKTRIFLPFTGGKQNGKQSGKPWSEGPGVSGDRTQGS